MKHKPGQVIFTDRARCVDCYRCLRVCPVKAISIRKGQAMVEEDLCIACGRCISECPQHAKSFRNDVHTAKKIMENNPGKVAVSLAPAFAAAAEENQRMNVPSALRRLGASFVAETSVGAYKVSMKSFEMASKRPEQPFIATACPTLVNYVEKYHPAAADFLVPVMSPMLAHAAHLKKKLGRDWKVIFVGPCISKKFEADRMDDSGAVDCVLTFTEFLQWLDEEDIRLDNLEPSGFDETPVQSARMFPVSGGLMRTAGEEDSHVSLNRVAVSGFREIEDMLSSLEKDPRPIFVEPLFCEGGCINGPGMPDGGDLLSRKEKVIRYAMEPVRGAAAEVNVSVTAAYGAMPLENEEVSEDEIRKVLEMTGKGDAENQLNCGACGYDTCREKAVAVIKGMAEPEMCMPYMRRLAERRTDKILDTSPNGIVILDGQLTIIGMNPAFREMFRCTDAVTGKNISYLMDPDAFEYIASGAAEKTDENISFDRYNLYCRRIAYALRQDEQYIGIFVDNTKAYTGTKQLESMKEKAVLQARELLEHQITMAESMAKFLGENTARGEEIVSKLIAIASEDSAGRE